MRRAALMVLATCLSLSSASTQDLSRYYPVEMDDGSDYLEGDALDFFNQLLDYLYDQGPLGPGEYREYPRPYLEPVENCGDDEDCIEPGDLMPPIEHLYNHEYYYG